jgi:serine/threonine protein kinase
MEDSSAQQLVGAVLSRRWKLVRLLGEGGMGAVYEGHGINGEGVRALKVLHPEFVTEESILQRFFAEAQACQQLGHPNIAQIFEHGTAEDGTPYLVMELLRGQPLSQYIHDRKLLTAEQAGPIVYGMLQALGAAHEKRIVHRDLKPDNVFLVGDAAVGGSGQFTVKVLDFGIAKVMDGAGGMGSKTRTGVLMGTPGYMSPEQIKNAKGVDPRSDLWSVGVMLFEMLTAKEVFPAENEFARLTAVLTQQVPSISSVAPNLAAWDPFFKRALAKDPAQRYQSAQEMAQALVQMTRGPAQSVATVGRAWSTVALPAFSQIPQAASMAGHQVAQQQHTPQQQGGYGTHGGQPHSMPAHSMPAHSAHSAQTPYAPQTAKQTFISPAPSQPAPSGQPHSGHSPSNIHSAGHPHPGSTPPPGGGPSTHISAGSLIPAPPTLTGGSSMPQIAVVAPPPLGAPWWVVGAVGAACLVIGFLVGYYVG